MVRKRRAKSSKVTSRKAAAKRRVRAQVGAGVQAVADDGDVNNGVNVNGVEGYKAALAERDKGIAELEAQVADTAKSAETAESLTKQIEELKASNEAERIGFELRLAGLRSATAAKALLGEHGGDAQAVPPSFLSPLRCRRVFYLAIYSVNYSAKSGNRIRYTAASPAKMSFLTRTSTR
mgnify:FL=1